MNKKERTCETCDRKDWCDGWEASFCCTLCIWQSGGEEPPWCNDCDPWDI